LTQRVSQRGSKAAGEITARTSENNDDVEELVLSQEDASDTHRTVRHFQHNDIIVNLTFPLVGNFCF